MRTETNEKKSMDSRDVFNLYERAWDLRNQVLDLSRENWESGPFAQAFKAAGQMCDELLRCFKEKAYDELFDQYSTEQEEAEKQNR